MRKTLGYIALGATLLVTVGGLAVAQAATHISVPETIVTQNSTTKQAYVNVGDKDWGPGDSFVTSGKLFDEAGVTQIGSSHVQCIQMPGKGWNLCNAALFIDGRGEIVGQGAFQRLDSTVSFDVPITGGTGDFDNVRGYVHVVPGSGSQETDTLYLLP
jgi:hypothetical protein